MATFHQYHVGDDVTISTTITDNTGALADPTTVTLTLRAPDGSTSTPGVVHDGVGLYHSTFPVTEVGSYLYQWTTTGTIVQSSDTQIFTVIGALVGPTSAKNGLWTYSGDPSRTYKDMIRYEIGDVDATDPLLNDLDIAFALTAWTSGYWTPATNPSVAYADVLYAAASCADDIAAQFAREVSYASDGAQVGTSELQDKYILLAQQLRLKAKRFGQAAVPYAGGISISDVQSVNADGDRAGTFFQMGMTDNLWAGEAAPTTASNSSPLISPPPGTEGGAF